MKTRTILPPLVLCVVAALTLTPASASQVEAASRDGPRVVLFERAHFRGQAIELVPGEELFDLSTVQFPDGRNANDAVSSILIEPGAAITVHTDLRGRGELVRFSTSIENLADVPLEDGLGSWNDTISSGRVEAVRVGSGRRRGKDREPRVIVYMDSKFRGDFLEIFPGERLGNLSREVFENGTSANDEISSIRVIGPVRVRVSSDKDFRADGMEVTKDVPDLRRVRRSASGSGTWNDAISSIVVERTSVVDDPGGGGPRPPPVDHDKFIRQLFSEMLGREPTDSERRAYARRMTEQRWSEAQVRADIERSREYRRRAADAIITRAYREILGRDPDPAGLESYRKALLDQGWDERRLREALRRSDEYRNKGGKFSHQESEPAGLRSGWRNS